MTAKSNPTSSNWLERIRPLHDRIVVQHLPEPKTSIIIVRENPALMDFVGQGENGGHDDNRRVFVTSLVVSVGGDVRGVHPGDVVKHTAWDDLPEVLRQPGWAMIREADIAGHVSHAS